MRKNIGDVYLDREGRVSHSCKNTLYILRHIIEWDHPKFGNIWKVATMHWAEGLGLLGNNENDEMADMDLETLELVGNLGDWDVLQRAIHGSPLDFFREKMGF